MVAFVCTKTFSMPLQRCAVIFATSETEVPLFDLYLASTYAPGRDENSASKTDCHAALALMCPLIVNAI